MRCMLSAMCASAACLVVAPGAVVAVADDYRDIAKPMFATPKAAAYCSIGESMEDANPVLKC